MTDGNAATMFVKSRYGTSGAILNSDYGTFTHNGWTYRHSSIACLKAEEVIE